MQAAQLPHSLNARPQIKMVGISENDTSAELFKQVLRDALHRRQRADWHEHRRLDLSVGRRDAASARGATRRL